jgi:hypothetical protein
MEFPLPPSRVATVTKLAAVQLVCGHEMSWAELPEVVIQ